MTSTQAFLDEMLAARLEPEARDWLGTSVVEIGGGAGGQRFGSLISVASRFLPRGRLEPSAAEIARAAEILPGWNPERWTLLETARVALALAHPELDREGGVEAVEDVFRYADDGEARALYRSLAHLPGPERFAWRAGEGCRTNIVPVFEAVACDTPYPFRYFDDVGWRQLAIKAVFINAPLWRVFGLDDRLSPELARMALDLADERRSAGRPVQPELWMCLGEHAGERGLAALEQEMDAGPTLGRRGAALGLARAGADGRLRAFLGGESDAAVRATIESALAGGSDQWAFQVLDARGG